MKWEDDTPIGSVRIDNEWPFGGPGFKPYWNGCGISEKFPTFKQAAEYLADWLEVYRDNKLRELRDKLRSIEAYKVRSVLHMPRASKDTEHRAHEGKASLGKHKTGVKIYAAKYKHKTKA